MYPAFDVRNLYYMCSVVTGRSRCPKTSLFSPSVSQSDTRGLYGRSGWPALRTILCQRKCIRERHSGVRRDVIKPGGSERLVEG